MPNPLQPDFDALMERTRTQLDLLARSVAEGRISPAEFGDLFASLLEKAHTEAVVLGRQAAGDTAPQEDDDRRFAELIVDGEAEFLADFVRAIEAGELDAAAIARRAEFYTQRLQGTANEAMGLTLDPGELVYWTLGTPKTDHCEDCPSIAAGSPYTVSTIPTWPGMNETSCLMACLCTAETASGLTGFLSAAATA